MEELWRRADEESLRRNLFYLSRDPLPFRRLNYTAPGRDQNSLYEADAFLQRQLESWGYTVEREGVPVQCFRFDSTVPKQRAYGRPLPEDPFLTAYNLYAQKVGKTRPEEIILLLAHKDSQSWVDSPGAYDNGVGTVRVLEMARLLAGYECQCSIRFLFCNEEHRPWTSVTAAQNARERGDNLIAIFNIDGIGGKPDSDIAAGRKTNVTLYTAPEGKRLADLMAQVNEEHGIGLVQSSYQRTSPGDDDGSFVNAGYEFAAANIGSYPYADAAYHLETDTPDRVDIVNVRMAVQATLAAVLRIDSSRE